MKSNNLLIGIGCMLASAVILYACQKDLSPSKPAPALIASTTSAATHENVQLSIANAPLGSHLVWTTTASANAIFRINNAGSATVSFNKPGTYKITCYFTSENDNDSAATYDSSYNPADTIPGYPHDTVPNYPHDTVPGYPDTTPGYPHDTVINYPHDTTPGYPHDTVINYPHDTTPGYPHDTVINYPHDTTPGYPHDTIPNHPAGPDSTHYSGDSLTHSHHGHVISSVSITITVR